MSQTISKALWIGAAIAAVVIATGILWPIVRTFFTESDDQRPTFPTSHGPVLEETIDEFETRYIV